MTHNGARDFDFLHGTWDVTHRKLTERLADSTEWVELSGSAECRALLGGLGNIDEISAEDHGVVGATLRLFHIASANWTIHWASGHTGRLEPPMVGRFENGVGMFRGDDHHDGRPVVVRFIWDGISSTTARWEQALSVDGGVTWEVNWVMSFTRSARVPA